MESKPRRRHCVGTRSVYITETMKFEVDIWDDDDEDAIERRIAKRLRPTKYYDPSKYDIAPSGRLIAGSKRVERFLINSATLATASPEAGAQNEQVAPAPVDQEMTMDDGAAQNDGIKT